MVVLQKRSFTLRGSRDALVLIRGFSPNVERDHHEAPATGSGDTPQLPHRRTVIAYVLEHMGADHRVEAGVREVKRLDVEPEIDAGLEEVSRYVPEMRYLS